mgnify:CR=1 FL=1
MSAKNKYTSEFKKTIVNLYHSGKSYAQIHNKYGISSSALSKWVKILKIDDDTVITALQNKELQKRNAQLEEKKTHIKKQLQYSLHTQTTIDCGKSSFKSTFNHHSLQSSPCKQKHILQMPPKPPQIKTDDSSCINLLAKNFNQPAPNMV